MYRDIRKLPPAHVLVAERGTVRTSRYWDLEFTGDGDAAREEDYLAELDAHLREWPSSCAWSGAGVWVEVDEERLLVCRVTQLLGVLESASMNE